MRQIQVEDLKHETEYTDAYYELSEDEIDALSNKTEEQYFTEKEKAWQADHQKRFREHLTSCTHPDCKRVLKNCQDAGFI